MNVDLVGTQQFTIIKYPRFPLTFAGGKISIDTETGKVTLKDIEPDEAAKEFWKAVENAKR